MQTFMTSSNYMASASHLDRQRLGKQRVEVKQILNSLRGMSKGWVNHPAVKMWRGYEASLAEYGIDICTEWRMRGYKDSLLPEFVDFYRASEFAGCNLSGPWWVVDPRVHLSHQSNLIRKDPAHYGPLFPGVPDNLPYYWPVP